MLEDDKFVYDNAEGESISGVWIVYCVYDNRLVIYWIHWSEIRARRYQRELGYGNVKFWPFGTQWSDE